MESTKDCDYEEHRRQRMAEMRAMMDNLFIENAKRAPTAGEQWTAAKAQQLIDEHNLSDTLLTMNEDSAEPQEDIEDFGRKGAPLDTGKKVDRWRWWLGCLDFWERRRHRR